MWKDLRRRPVHLAVLVLCMVGIVVHQATRWDWFIDDAGICFAYARNVANGEGFVPWPGAERIEGISDPTWMVILVLFQLVGLDGFIVAKPLGMLFAMATVPVVYRLAQIALPDDDGPAPLFAPITLAVSSQLAIWSASGLENALWCFLLACAMLATVTDARSGRFARSAGLYLLLAWTRPEGVLYAAFGGAWWLYALRRAGFPVLRPMLGWLAIFWIPSLALEAARLAYFAWPLSNTYYSKIVARENYPFGWDARGWLQVREYADRMWHGWYLPVYLVGLLGLDGRTPRRAFLATALVGLTLLWPAPDALDALRIWPDLPEAPKAWVFVRMLLLVGTSVLLPFAAVGRPGWEVRVLCWTSAIVAVLFSVYAGGDWMGAFRWMSLMVPCLAVLLAVGVGTLADRLEVLATGHRSWGTVGWLAAAFGVCAQIAPNLTKTADHAWFNFNETTDMIRRRALFTRSVVEKTMYEGTVYNLEMDVGGNLWERPEMVHVDMAGLVDIAMARHFYPQSEFIEEYVFEEHPPTFGHVHGWWAKFTRFKEYPQWAEMVDLPDNDEGPRFPPHDGMWGRRTLFVDPAWTSPAGRRVGFAGGFALQGFDTPTGPWPQGADGYLEAGFSTAVEREDDVHVIAFLSDGARVVSFDLAMGYGLFPVPEWRPGEEVFVGKYPLPVPADLPEGVYDLGFVVLAADGTVLVPEVVPAGAVTGSPRYAAGEVRFPGAIRVVPAAEVTARAEGLRGEVLAEARAGRCEEAEQEWILAKRHRPRDRTWHARQLPAIRRALADCWARRGETEPAEAPAHLARAHRWDHHSPELARVGEPVGDRLWVEGKAARAAGDWETAYRRFTALLAFEPWRSWARRYAEEARDHRLDLDWPPFEETEGPTSKPEGEI